MHRHIHTHARSAHSTGYLVVDSCRHTSKTHLKSYERKRDASPHMCFYSEYVFYILSLYDCDVCALRLYWGGCIISYTTHQTTQIHVFFLLFCRFFSCLSFCAVAIVGWCHCEYEFVSYFVLLIASLTCFAIDSLLTTTTTTTAVTAAAAAAATTTIATINYHVSEKPSRKESTKREMMK